METALFGWTNEGGGGGGGGIGGGGTLNYIAKFTPDGVNVGNSQLFDDGTSVGLGTATPTGKFNVFGMASGINQRLEPVANVTEDVSGATVNTTDATTTTLQTIAIPNDSVVLIESRVTCRKTGGVGVGTTGQGNGYIRTAAYHNIGGVVTLSGSVQTSYTGESIVAFSCTLTISGSNVLVRVTGAVDDNVTWNAVTRLNKVA